MIKIGTTTLYRNYNYGSILQCFALQQILRNQDCDATVINQRIDIMWRIYSIVRKISFLSSCVVYPQRYISYYNFKKESRRSCHTLPSDTVAKMDDFISKYIKEDDISFHKLKFKEESKFDGFITGSDQVWSLASPMLNPFLFLEFTKPQKRFSYAASFGTDTMPIWYKKSLLEKLNKMSSISIRESTALSFLSSYRFNTEPVVSMDPVLLYTASSWRAISTIPLDLKGKKYILLYFLNTPSELAIKHIKNLSLAKDIDVYSFPYEFKTINELPNYKGLLKLSPTDFIGAIDGAEIICTDSFHGAVMSINLSKPFFNYFRSYNKIASQNNRVVSLLNRYGLESTVVSDENQLEIVKYDISTQLEKDRDASNTYINRILNEISNDKQH